LLSHTGIIFKIEEISSLQDIKIPLPIRYLQYMTSKNCSNSDAKQVLPIFHFVGQTNITSY